MEVLWRIYKTNVAPMIALLHKPSIESMLLEARAKPTVDLEPESEVLIRAILFAAIVSVIPLQCQAAVGYEHDACIQEYQLAVERSLTRANLVSSNDVRVLQAAVLYLLCLRCVSDSRQVWAEAAIVVRVAQRQGIHRDGQNLGLSPFDTEMRRRLWWHICILDMLCSEDQGTDTQIHPGMFDTKPPRNIDSDFLAPGLIDLPPPQAGFTDITLCIIQSEIMTSLAWTGKSFGSGSNPSSLQKEHEILPALAAHLEDNFLRQLDLEDPVQWVIAVIARLTLSRASLISHLSNSASDRLSMATDDESFNMALEILEFVSLLQNNDLSAQWAWIFKSYQQQHVVALILSELSARPISSETDHAWDLVKAIYDGWQREKQNINSQLQEPLSLLMERASISRMKKLNDAGL
ncbi:hypothetical protein N7492_005077 [Penicillium capsulatum]|uniref:Xylanolytic transcriptional activator regulatory domain-containing protein n=1 Tax=Penicillium capsulatum TaxID=69766 RepID=A0A9W9I8R3_9EURO|nr:hypothetical protein N7492_005077 [Penicillium capsulatum]